MIHKRLSTTPPPGDLITNSQVGCNNTSNNQSTKAERDSNLETLRIASIFLIVAMHVIGFAASQGVLSTENTYLRYFVGTIGNLGVSCFVLLSGYFGVKFSWKKFVYISLITTVYACICSFCNSGYAVTGDMIMAIVWVPRYFNWYISCYLALMLLSGHLNNFCNQLDRKDFMKLLVVLSVLFSLLPMMVSANDVLLIRSGQCFTYFVFAYFIGRYIRIHKDIKLSRWKTGLTIFAMVLLMWLKGLLSMRIHALSMIPLTSNYSPTVLIAAISCLYFFKSFSIQSRLINYISASVLAMYLLDQLRPTVDRYICVYKHTQDGDFILYVIIEVVVIFLVSFIIDKIRVHLLDKPEKWITDNLVSVCRWIQSKIYAIID